jgi:hypothetical protein
MMKKHTNVPTPFSFAAVMMFRKPVTFTSLLATGSLIDRGTEPNAACGIQSMPLQAFIQAGMARISPSVNSNEE